MAALLASFGCVVLIFGLFALFVAASPLAVTLHLDSSVTLVPSIETLPPIRLVREDLAIGELLDIAVTFRASGKRPRRKGSRRERAANK